MKWVLAVALALAGCGRDSSEILGVAAPATVRNFVRAQSPGVLRGYAPVLEDTGARLLVFRVSYGSAPCTTGCPVPKAYGLALGERVGWLDGPAGTGAFFDVASGDTLLFDPGLWEKLAQSEPDASSALQLRLASDHDTPPATLLSIARGLHAPTGPAAVGHALLTNPSATASLDVLSALARIDAWFSPSWYGVADTAWQLLAPRVPPLARLQLHGLLVRTPDGLIHPGGSARNAGTSPTLLRYGPYCTPVMQLFRDSSPTGAPIWDAERWWWTSHAGGCKLPPNIVQLQPGDSLALGAGEGFRVADVLGDSIPPGRYAAAMRIRVATPAGDTTDLAPAGTLDLTR